ncbi:hypothetical protein BN341_3970 [Helicobacter heilmannii ASB1.4]|uniref:Uncharacterized protein n=1 Tax=Helicobacter heilmannii TaxID=35817 RepID=A0A0K2Y4R8_HELHE|nr:hypothetical protein BN341_3920 [Helicobacter heilmannii ASB1.4]CCM73373.1 hypothetical protein BN341_3970 [Helicobacter heilmannii ASB1.4]CRI34136.1 hypothetical protein HHE01_09820 [Helicobacter heilmannii]
MAFIGGFVPSPRTPHQIPYTKIKKGHTTPLFSSPSFKPLLEVAL